MFLGQGKYYGVGYCFPRVRGDVPVLTPGVGGLGEFSPRARGCSGAFVFQTDFSIVFPACAGMFLNIDATATQAWCFPRVRGDVPDLFMAGVDVDAVFPACAGMFPRSPLCKLLATGFPRVRGDVPRKNPLTIKVGGFPRVRGDVPRNPKTPLATDAVFPACAGMFRQSSPTMVVM